MTLPIKRRSILKAVALPFIPRVSDPGNAIVPDWPICRIENYRYVGDMHYPLKGIAELKHEASKLGIDFEP